MIDERSLLNWLRNYQFENYAEVGHEKEYNFIESLIKGIENEPKVGEWISCSERLPGCNGCYLVWRPHFFGGEIGMPAICYFDGQDTWYDFYGVNFKRILNKSDVVAWQPLPEPYKEE